MESYFSIPDSKVKYCLAASRVCSFPFSNCKISSANLWYSDCVKCFKTTPLFVSLKIASVSPKPELATIGSPKLNTSACFVGETAFPENEVTMKKIEALPIEMYWGISVYSQDVR